VLAGCGAWVMKNFFHTKNLNPAMCVVKVCCNLSLPHPINLGENKGIDLGAIKS
jgi:hypothetical protein